MSKKKLWAALTALACLGVAIGLGWADNNVLNHGTYYQNGTNGAKVDPNGNAYSNDVNYGAWTVFPNIINGQLGASGAALVDSSVALATYPYKRMALLLQGQFDSLSTIVRIAVEVRGHYTTSTDSSSTFPWYRWPQRATANGTTDIDSLGHMFVGLYAVAQATTANQPFATSSGIWPGEFMVKFNVARQDTVDGSGGLGKFGAIPKTMWIPLQDQNGAWFNAPYTSVRFRVINGVKSRFQLRADLVGMQ